MIPPLCHLLSRQHLQSDYQQVCLRCSFLCALSPSESFDRLLIRTHSNEGPTQSIPSPSSSHLMHYKFSSSSVRSRPPDQSRSLSAETLSQSASPCLSKGILRPLAMLAELLLPECGPEFSQRLCSRHALDVGLKLLKTLLELPALCVRELHAWKDLELACESIAVENGKRLDCFFQ